MQESSSGERPRQRGRGRSRGPGGGEGLSDLPCFPRRRRPEQWLGEPGRGRAFIRAPPLLSTTWANLQRRHSLLPMTTGLSGSCPSLSQHPLARPAHAASEPFRAFLLRGLNDSRHLPAGGCARQARAVLLQLLAACLVLCPGKTPLPCARSWGRLCWDESCHRAPVGPAQPGAAAAVHCDGTPSSPAPRRQPPSSTVPQHWASRDSCEGPVGLGQGWHQPVPREPTWASVILASCPSWKSTRGLSPPSQTCGGRWPVTGGGCRPAPLGWRVMHRAEQAVPERSAFDLAFRNLAPL